MTDSKDPGTGPSPPEPRPPADGRGRRGRHRLLIGGAIIGLAFVLAIAFGVVHLITTKSSQSKAAVTNCAPDPSACGFPDRTNTGVPAGTTLKTVGTGPGQVSSGTGWKFSTRAAGSR